LNEEIILLLPTGIGERFSQTISTWTDENRCTVIRFVWVSAKFATCTVVSVNGTLVEAKT
jgi:hypothetical protein